MTWSYLASEGDVTHSCIPYTAGDGFVEPCRSECLSVTEPLSRYKCQSGTVVRLSSASSIMTELKERGPMEFSFDVYEDFYNYKSGIY